MSAPAYESYKDSGVEWLGQVPSHWTASPLKWISSLVTGMTPPTSESEFYTEVPGTPWVRPDDIIDNQKVCSATKFLSEKGEAISRLIHDRAVVVCCIGTIGKIAVSEGPFTTNQQIVSVLFSASMDFNYYALVAARSQLESMSVGNVLKILNTSRLGELVVPLPPREEATAIAAFLDRETGKIDALIEAHTRLIELLKEKRQAVISHAVTKGLNPDAPMKDSGIEWLGQVPAHWEVKRLSTEAAFFQGKAHEPFIEDDGEHICVTARYVSTSGAAQKNCSLNLSPAMRGDILMVMSDLPNGRALARAFLVNDDRSYAVNQRVCSIRFRAGDARYFSYQLNRNMQLLQFNDGVEQTHLKNAAFTKLTLAVPPADEQAQIADQITSLISRFDLLTREAESMIALLIERRFTIISAAVTGKIDVRGLVNIESEAA